MSSMYREAVHDCAPEVPEPSTRAVPDSLLLPVMGGDILMQEKGEKGETTR